MTKVFISYSHDSDQHCQYVLKLSDRLNSNHIDCEIDQYVNGTPEEGWPLWMVKKLNEADFVLVVCTKTYLDRVERKAPSGTGKGVKWESLLTYQDIYENDSLNRKFVPIYFNTADSEFLPKPLKAVTHYDLAEEGKYEMLYRYLTSQPLAIKPLPDQKLHLPPKNSPVITNTTIVDVNFIDQYLAKRLENALRTFSSQPKVWVPPILSRKSELDKDAKSQPKLNLVEFISNPRSTIIKAPPQYGQTCLAHYLIREAWRSQSNVFWLYLDSNDLKPHTASINEAILSELKTLGLEEKDIKCVILDSWTSNEKDSIKLLKDLCKRFENTPIVCMHQVDIGQFNQLINADFGRQFEVQYLWTLSREHIRKIVSDYNEAKYVGDEDAVTARITLDLDVLNLHRTPLNCLTLLKVSEIDFEESPINRTEMIKRVLFLLFNVDEIPTYKTRPDLKDCEYVLGRFCELLIREGSYEFTREKFINETQKCCHERLIDLETSVVFDVLYANNILIKRGSFFHFKFSYWIFYFAAQRMHHDQDFANYIFEDMRYAQRPDLIEFYTGIDRMRDDALLILTKDIKACSESMKNKSGLPEGLNPYEFATWKPSPDAEVHMQQVIANGVLESNLPAAIKDQFADRNYDPSRPYDQSITSLLTDYSFMSMMRIIRAGSRALRNSDYVSPAIKRELLNEIMNCWEQASKVLFIVLPILAEKGHALFDGANFVLTDDFGDTPQQRYIRILGEIPYNVTAWCQDDLYSRKMGPLLIDMLGNKNIGGIIKHELILLLIYKRPRDWNKHVQRYIVDNKKNSYYLYNVYRNLLAEHQFGYASPQTLRDIEYLIKMAATKHATGDKDPGIKSINKVMKVNKDLIPPREAE